VAGVVCVALGLVGVVVPLLPTTPFLLLAAACFARSSERLHGWLVRHPVLGAHLRGEGKGPSRTAKIVTLVVLWASLFLSALLAVPSERWWLRLVLLAIGVGVTVFLYRKAWTSRSA
jgi:uncharacterized membrane protein YbaN (DUF454 family)